MSYSEEGDRWSDNGPACPYCGRRIVSGWVCQTCESGQVVQPAEAADPRLGARPGWLRVGMSAEEVTKWRADCAAFDVAQMAKAEVVPEEERGAVDGVAVQEVWRETERPSVYDVWPKAPEGARKESESDMKRGDAFPGKHLKADDFPTGTRVAVVVDHVSSEEVGSGKDAEEKAVCYFRGKEKGLVLNQTNWSMLEGITGEEDSDNWSGTKCVLYRTTTQFGGKTVPALRLDPMPLGTQTARTVTAPAMRPAPLPPTLPPPIDADPADDYHVSDDDVPFSLALPVLLGLVGFGSLIV